MQVLFPLLALVPRKEVQHGASQSGSNERNSIETPLLLESQRGEDDSRRSFDENSFRRDDDSPDEGLGQDGSSEPPASQPHTS